jgi:1-acyl-sn-glycerol-3-phosphate acyltransferase
VVSNFSALLSDPPLAFSRTLLGALGMQMSIYQAENIPQATGAVLVVSNHRSFMDAAILIEVVARPLRIACHHYMGKTPILRDILPLLGGFPLADPQQRHQQLFEQATEFLQARQWVALFPEGGLPMVELTAPHQVGQFQRGFAHLALRVDVPKLAVLPIAIASQAETVISPFPLRWLHLFDPSEPLFDRSGWHPVAIYHRVNVAIGRPYWITEPQRQQYRGKKGKAAVTELTEYCHQEIADLVKRFSR